MPPGYGIVGAVVEVETGGPWPQAPVAPGGKVHFVVVVGVEVPLEQLVTRTAMRTVSPRKIARTAVSTSSTKLGSRSGTSQSEASGTLGIVSHHAHRRGGYPTSSLRFIEPIGVEWP